MTRSTLEELLARCERATEGSRELDWQIADALGQIPEHTVRNIGFDYDWYRRPLEYSLHKADDAEGRQMSHWTPAPVTSSIDAIVGLIEREFPTSGWAVYRTGTPHGKEPYYARLLAYRLPKMKRTSTPALALCVAFLKAKLSLPGGDE